MRFDRIHIGRFGALRDRELSLAGGMNVIFGPNEAGKSTWHATLFLAFCGCRRGKGRRQDVDRELLDRYRPWDGGPCEVTLEVTLEDGRRLEIWRDLASGGAVRVTDAVTGRDVAAEVIHEGSPDGARWLGLDRQSFPATACVRQGDLLQVLGEARRLQEQLQRTADTSGADTTAQRALEIIDRYHRDHIGVCRAGSQRPLAAARRRVELAREALETARSEHAEHLALAVEADRLREREAATQRELRRIRAVVAWSDLQSRRQRLEKARELAPRLEAAPPGAGGALDGELLRRVARALEAWRHCPSEPELDGPSAAELRRQLAELPMPPDGEVEPAADVLEAHDAFQVTRRALKAHSARRPATTPALESENTVRRAALVATALLTIAAFLPSSLSGVALTTAIAGGALALVGLSWSVTQTLRARQELRVWQEMQSELEDEARELGRRLEVLLRRREAVTAAATDGAGARPEEPEDTTLQEAVEVYRSRCLSRSKQALAASRRRELARRIERREAAESAATEARRRRRVARRQLRAVARACSLRGRDPEVLYRELERWLAVRERMWKTHHEALQDRETLGRLLQGDTLAGLAESVERSLESLRGAIDEFTLPVLDGSAGEEPLDASDVERAQREARRVTGELARILGRLRERESLRAPVSEAEEELAAAESELEHLELQDRVLKQTRAFLERARDRVHRELAPQLAGAVSEHLPRLTAGRYHSVRVDPDTLRVQVGGDAAQWLDVNQLSHGTAEQVYLLLRTALVDRLTVAGEVCPLLLDDVTVHFDRDRKLAALETLRELAAHRQVIVFTQETSVLEWAREHLRGDRHTVCELAGVASPQP